jgi:hypothetical protein
LNPRPAVYKTAALPLSYTSKTLKMTVKTRRFDSLQLTFDTRYDTRYDQSTFLVWLPPNHTMTPSS